ncbi:uncharacterized protein V6R79_005777 [Siganus canaliculatus]
MSRYFTVWVSFGILSTLFLTAGAIKCSEKEKVLEQMRAHDDGTITLTDCLLECTGMTYIKKLQLQDSHTIRMRDSREGDLGEYCWSTELKCNPGESFTSAYVVVPVDVSSVGHETLEVRSTAPTAATLTAHNGPITVAESCGLRYDVTQHFGTENPGALFCIQVTTREDTLGDKVLKCPPYLVTFWQRRHDQSNQEGAG